MWGGGSPQQLLPGLCVDAHEQLIDASAIGIVLERAGTARETSSSRSEMFFRSQLHRR